MKIKETVAELEQVLPMEEIPKNNTNAALSESKNVEIDENDINFIDESLNPPDMDVAFPQQLQNESAQLITDQQYLGVLNEIMENIRDDRKQVSEYIDNVANMVINEGDATSSSKEALVNLVKVKTDLSDKMLKAADLMTRLKLKNTNTVPAHVSALQQNNYNFGADTTDFSRRELIKAINQAKKNKEN